MPGVVSVGATRARWTGHRLEAELEVEVDPSTTVEAGDALARAVGEHLRTHVRHLDRTSVRLRPSR